MAEKKTTQYIRLFFPYSTNNIIPCGCRWKPWSLPQTPSLINGSIRLDPLGLVLPFSLDNNLRSVTRDRGTTEKRSCSSVDLENFLDSVDIPIFDAFRALVDLSTQPSCPYSDFLTETILSYKSIEFLYFIRTSKTCNDTEANLISLELQAMFTKEISCLQFVSLQDRYFAIAMFFIYALSL